MLAWLDEHFEECLCTGCLMIVSSCILLQVVMRYVFSASSPWAEELAVYCMIFAIYFGACMGARERSHIRITMLVNELPRPLAVGSVVLADLLWAAFVAFMIVQTSVYTKLLFDVVYISPGLGIEQKWVQLVIPFALCLLLFRIIQVYWCWYKDDFRGLPL